MILASIFIGPPGRGEDLILPPIVEQNIDSFTRHHSHLPHTLFSGEDIVAFLEDKFPREVLDAYRALRPASYKADLARYCILHELGGIYADLSHFFMHPLPFDSERPILFRDLLMSAPWDTNTSVFAVPPRHKALELVIDLVCANVARRYYGPTFLCPTGPTLFGKAWATVCEPEDLVSGHAVAVPRANLRKAMPKLTLPEIPSIHCLLLGSRIAVIKRKRMGVGGLADLGVAESDNYVDRWNERDVYESRVEQG
jgi:hypothetical protein